MRTEPSPAETSELADMLQLTADEYGEPVYLITDTSPRKECLRESSRLPYGVLRSAATAWEIEVASQVIYPQKESR